MKKLLCLMIALMMAVSAACAEESFSFEDLTGKIFEFSSGAGGWYTELTFNMDGSFTGNFHDSEMGDTGDDYPDGTLYGCTFHGLMTAAEKLNDYTWKLTVDSLELDEGQPDESIEDGIRYVTCMPYGLENVTELLLYLPGAPVSGLPEGYQDWMYLHESGDNITELPYYGLYNEADQCGFVSYDAEGLQQ